MDAHGDRRMKTEEVMAEMAMTEEMAIATERIGIMATTMGMRGEMAIATK